MPLESPGHAGAQTSMQSTILLHNRIRVRSQGSAGTSRGFGKASSRYSQINVDSMIAFPSCTSVGTMPLGLSFKYFGSYCSALNKSTLTDSQSSPLARIVIRTFWQHTELPKS